MEPVFLNVPYAQKDAVKALGARFDWSSKRWYVPPGIDPAPFARWLGGVDAAAGGAHGAPLPRTGGDVFATPQPVVADTGPVGNAPDGHATTGTERSRGRSLASLLAEVSLTVSGRFREPVWVRAELVPFEPRHGHLYVDLVEHDAQGVEAARARAMVWAGDRDRVVGAFEAASGVRFAGGIRVLVRVAVTFHERFGLSLAIREIDPDFTLGELAMRRRRIREQLVREGVFGRNRALAAPRDFFRLIVIAPAGAAGLGDFRKEADRLERFGLCRFHYLHATFQGPDTSASLSAALAEAAALASEVRAEAIAVLRGGGATADLHWLDDLAVARAICTAPVPVLIGIGHERDRTVLDEVARQSLGTPSKLAGHIESTIAGAAAQARDAFAALVEAARHASERAATAVERWQATLAGAARTRCARASTEVERLGLGAVADARRAIDAADHDASRAVAAIESSARARLREAGRDVDAAWARTLPDALRRVAVAGQALDAQRAALAREAWRHHGDAAADVRRLAAEVVGLGPERTLQRGFVVVRGGGVPLSARASALTHDELELQFRDGRVSVRQPRAIEDEDTKDTDDMRTSGRATTEPDDAS